MKKNYRYRVVYCFAVFFFFITTVYAQEDSLVLRKNDVSHKQITISYTLKINSNIKNGIAESYNGAIKTIYFQPGKIRSRFVALMRIQSVFYYYNQTTNETTHIYIVKESGKKNYSNSITKERWQEMNKKYKEAHVEYFQDSIKILDYSCNKAVVTLQDGKIIICYYTPEISIPELGYVEPLFSLINGMVLQYEYVNNKSTFIYKATKMSFAPISNSVYSIPGK